MFGQFPRYLLILLLVARLAQVPTPWLHCHQDIEQDSLAGHQVDWHQGQSNHDLFGGWHLHFIATNRLGVSDHHALPIEDSDDSTNLPSSQAVCFGEIDSQGYLLKEILGHLVEQFQENRSLSCGASQSCLQVVAADASHTLTAFDQWRYARSVLLV